MRRLIPLFALGSVAASMAAAGNAPTLEITRFSVGQSHYLESCGGCHGLLGVSSNQHVPPLKDVVGTFLCTAEGRDYIVRLPNVAFAPMNDDVLAATMNFVVFGLGGASTPLRAAPYTPAEVRVLRQAPLKNRQLASLRYTIFTEAAAHCEDRARIP